ncbi:tryptophan--tRNA ligase [Candidatus Pacearchaeota archaeon]|nr:tryptophan--tRNA ligase [Candidatus Pacearchaeota archaeon]
MERKRIVSGMRTTGRLHLGNLVSTMENWLRFQEEDECFFEIADLHALTDRTDYSEIKDFVINMGIDWLALGIDPHKSTIFVQSNMPEHMELYTLFSMITPVSWLERCPVYKDKTNGNNAIQSLSLGLLSYPVLQAADIAIYKATHVPVGIDQAPHVELTREIIRRFNSFFGEVFSEPQTIMTKTPKLLGTDGRKMSKSYGNVILPSDSIDFLEEKITRMITDPQKIRKNDLGHPDICSVYTLHNFYNSNKEEVADECGKGLRGCVDCKKQAAKEVYNHYSEYREKRKFYTERIGEVYEILNEGTKKARTIARQTLDEVMECMKINY